MIYPLHCIAPCQGWGVVPDTQATPRLFDIAYDGYNGGKDDTIVSWTEESGHRSYRTLQSESANTTMPYTGPSIMVGSSLVFYSI